MEHKIIDPTTYPNWDNLITTHFDPDIFHSSEWCGVLKFAYNYTPRYFLFTHDAQPLAVIPLMEIKSILTSKRAVSLPFSDFCHPLSKSHSDLEFIKKEIINWGHNNHCRYVEFRSSQFNKNVVPFEVYYTHDIDLTMSLNETWKRLRDNNRRNIKKAIRLGLKVRFEKDRQSLQDFYRLQVITRKRHGLPPQPFKFFKLIFDQLIEKDYGIIASVYYKNRMIAAAIFFFFNHKAIFKFGASDHVYHSLRPNNLIMWEAICWLKDTKCNQLNLGRTSPQDRGLLSYKRSFVEKESELLYFRHYLNNKTFIKSKWNKYDKLLALIGASLPTCLLKIIGKAGYRHIA